VQKLLGSRRAIVWPTGQSKYIPIPKIRLKWQTYAEYSAVPAKFTIRVPDNVDTGVAAGSLIGGLTALTMVRESYAVKKGDWILVHAAAGGTGLILGQVLKNLGAHSIGTVGGKEKAELAKEAGFEHVIESYDHGTVLSKVKELTNGEGVICVYDGVNICPKH
jgi:NADPH:quinone reductase